MKALLLAVVVAIGPVPYRASRRVLRGGGMP